MYKKVDPPKADVEEEEEEEEEDKGAEATEAAPAAGDTHSPTFILHCSGSYFLPLLSSLFFSLMQQKKPRRMQKQEGTM